ncbi:hypothetical protein Tb11.01.7360 [Trypanosoma brucei brucei TREU927]|uniref:T. brucei spp.-specific protein n=1 Tax=Trypanosoma brucei brucei (strain 927/4 GUTat10.1) TaxID=185431 RepID=Q381L4_TRYB2|nr:hypothetical protein Tb11.01.7360 [Trypanosoma brucei brucei TREU927]EAN80517.1 hypothetical protein Tb11.01.7360 [Trypanosoma brucei brucei TREU927]
MHRCKSAYAQTFLSVYPYNIFLRPICFVSTYFPHRCAFPSLPFPHFSSLPFPFPFLPSSPARTRIRLYTLHCRSHLPSSLYSPSFFFLSLLYVRDVSSTSTRLRMRFWYSWHCVVSLPAFFLLFVYCFFFLITLFHRHHQCHHCISLFVCVVLPFPSGKPQISQRLLCTTGES